MKKKKKKLCLIKQGPNDGASNSLCLLVPMQGEKKTMQNSKNLVKIISLCRSMAADSKTQHTQNLISLIFPLSLSSKLTIQE
jgi:hypothetical protein